MRLYSKNKALKLKGILQTHFQFNEIPFDTNALVLKKVETEKSEYVPQTGKKDAVIKSESWKRAIIQAPMLRKSAVHAAQVSCSSHLVESPAHLSEPQCRAELGSCRR